MDQPSGLEKIVEFISSVPPFRLLPPKVIKEVAATMLIEYYAKGETILDPGKTDSRFLYIIRSGGVKLLYPSSEEKGREVADYREEREFFGLGSLLRNEPVRFEVVAVENTICYLMKRDVFLRLIDEYPRFLLYFTAGPSKGYANICKAELEEYRLNEQAEITGNLMSNIRVRELMCSDVLTCSPRESVRKAAELMTERRVGSIVVVDDNGGILGIVTDRDLRTRIIATGESGANPVAKVMTESVQTISPRALCFEALILMCRWKIAHLPVVEDGYLHGIISQRDLVALEGYNPVGIVKRIDGITSVSEAVALRQIIDHSIRLVLEHGTRAKELCEIVTCYNDALTRKIIALAEAEIMEEDGESPPASYAWIALGSEGRREQSLRTDQDNAIVYADEVTCCNGQGDAVQQYFLRLAEKVVSGLKRCGFPRCKAGFMASNPMWCQPESKWREYFRSWILDYSSPPQKVLNLSVFFDFRHLCGPYEFVPGFRQAIFGSLEKHRGFLVSMATGALSFHPPLGFFKRLLVFKSDHFKNKVDLKVMGLALISNAVRVLALDHQISETNTLDRIQHLTERNVISVSESKDLEEAFNVFMLIRVQHHLGLLGSGESEGDNIDPAELSSVQRSMLKESFQVVRQLQEKVKSYYSIDSF